MPTARAAQGAELAAQMQVGQRIQNRGMVAGCGHPMGPLRLTDLIGLDTVKAIADSMYAEFKEPLYAPPRWLP